MTEPSKPKTRVTIKKPLQKQEKSKGGAQWRPGQSGNPKGRKPGTGEVTKLRNAIAKHIPGILNQVVEAAKNGDLQAARLLLDRVIPPLKASESPVELTLPNGSLTDQGRAVLAAVGAGTLAPSQGTQLLSAIGTLARVSEIDEIEQRLAALEGEHEKQR